MSFIAFNVNYFQEIKKINNHEKGLKIKKEMLAFSYEIGNILGGITVGLL